MRLNDSHGQNVFVHFYHDRVHHLGGERRITLATVHLGPCAKKERPCGTRDAVTGRAICNPVDPFIPVLGRKIALTRAFERAKLSKEQRAELWKDYWRVSGSYKQDKDTKKLILIKLGMPERGILGKSRKKLALKNGKTNP